MKFKLISDRMLSSDNKFAGYNNENRAELLEFEFPENLKNYTKTINFETTEGNFFDILDGDTYILKNNITKYYIVSFYIEFKKQISETEYEIIKTETKRLQFRESFDVDKEIPEEEINILDKLIVKIDEIDKRVTYLEEHGGAVNSVNSVNGKTGDVNLNAEDVGALPNTTKIPVKTSDLKNDSGFIDKTYHDNTKVDKEYGKVLSTNDYTDEEKEKLSRLENYDDNELRMRIINAEDDINRKPSFEDLLSRTIEIFSISTPSTPRAMVIQDNRYIYHNAISQNKVVKLDTKTDSGIPSTEWTIGGHKGYVTRGMCTDGKYLFVPYRDNVSGTSYKTSDTIGGYLDVIDLTLENPRVIFSQSYSTDMTEINNIKRYYGKTHYADCTNDLLCVTQQLGGWILYSTEGLNLSTPQLIQIYREDSREQSMIDKTEYQQPKFFTANGKQYLAICGYSRHLVKVYEIDNNVVTEKCAIDLHEVWKECPNPDGYLHTMGLDINYPYIYCSIAPAPTYISDFENTIQGIAVVNIEDVENPNVEFFKIPDKYRTTITGGEPSPNSITIYENYLYEDMGIKGVAVWDITNRAEPTFIGENPVEDRTACSIYATEDKIYIGTDYNSNYKNGGIYIYSRPLKLNEYVDEQDAKTLDSAKQYANEQVPVIFETYVDEHKDELKGEQGADGKDGANGKDGKNYSVEVVESTTTTLEIQPNKFYKFGEVTELSLTLAEITDTTQLNEYMFEFVSGSTATTLTLPDTIKWLETPTIESNKIYQCSIVDNIGVLLGVSNV